MQGIVRIVAYLGVGLVAGFAIAQWMSQDDGETASPDDATWLAGRIDALERELARERSARAALAAAIEELRAAISSEDAYGSDADLPWMREPGGIVRVERELAESAAELEGSPVPAAGSVRFGGRPSAEEIERRRRERFIAAGFTPDRVQWIERRIDELRLEALEAEYEAARRGEVVDPRARSGIDERLRAELGDAEYEKYLTAMGRPTAVAVRDVLPGSAAERSGLRAGDVIVSYGGRRVFGVAELNRLTLEGRPGETVVVDVLRDGQPMQIYLPRGPIGIASGRGPGFRGP